MASERSAFAVEVGHQRRGVAAAGGTLISTPAHARDMSLSTRLRDTLLHDWLQRLATPR